MHTVYAKISIINYASIVACHTVKPSLSRLNQFTHGRSLETSILVLIQLFPRNIISYFTVLIQPC